MINEPKPPSIDEIHGEVNTLSHLIDEIATKVFETPNGPDESVNKEMNRLGALLWIARDMVERIEKQIGDNIGSFRHGRVI